MTLPAGFALPADADAGAVHPLHVVDKAGFAAWRDAQPSAVQAWLAAQRFDGSAGTAQSWADPEGGIAGAVLGIGDALDAYSYSHAPLALPAGDWQAVGERDDAARHALHLGWGLGCYRFDRYKKNTRAPARLVDAFDPETLDVLAACVRVRDLVNTPTEHMGPDELEGLARELAATHGATVSVIAGEELLAQNYPAIHAVGRASHRAPRIIELAWGDVAHPHVAICGKGVCFDTGGLDLKTAVGMRNMKKDMGGAAHALALAELLMARKLPLRLTVLVPAVENAVGPDAFRPGEVVATRTGTSVEIDNTDAEGRMVLCDALARACELKPDLLLKSTHQHHSLKQRLLGNSCWQLLRHCPVPLWLVKNGDLPYHKLCAALDPLHAADKPAALDQQLIAAAQLLSASLGIQPHYLHSYAAVPQSLLFDSALVNDYEHYRELSATQHREAFEQLLRKTGVPHSQGQLREGFAEEEIARFVREEHIDLLLIGAISRSHLANAFIGNTAERVLESVDCDLLILKAPVANC